MDRDHTELTLRVSRSQANTALGTLVRSALDVPWSVAKKLCMRGKVRVDGVPVTDPGERLRVGAEVVIDPHGRGTEHTAGPVSGTGSEAALVLDRARLVHIDPHLVVIDKPAGINTVPFEQGERGALVDRLAVALHRWKLAPANAPLFVVHRLDRETTGLLVFGRTWVAKRHLASLFRAHDIERVYVALVHGKLSGTHRRESVLLDDRGDGLRGSARGSTPQHVGQRAVTHVTSLAELPNEGGATLVECRLDTGRQHQIRIHLAEMGHPVIGDRVYTRHYKGVVLPAPRVMLHARTLGFTHPAHPDEAPLRFESPIPEDFKAVACRLGWA